MADSPDIAAGRRLPRGRHQLSRDQVETDQRLRIAVGMAEAMQDGGYVGTSVAEIIRRAGVSRETFYRLHDDKADCFLAAFDLVAAVLVERVRDAAVTPGDRMDRVAAVIESYLQLLADEPAYARLFLVEVNAAGPEAILRRAAVQAELADGLVGLLDVGGSERGAVATQLVVAAVGSLVVPLLVADDLDALVGLGPLVIRHLAELDAAGWFGPDPA